MEYDDMTDILREIDRALTIPKAKQAIAEVRRVWRRYTHMHGLKKRRASDD